MRVIYADSMFLLNFTLDYLLLLAAGKICSLPLRRWRMALGAAWGGLSAVLAAIYPEPFSPAAVKLLCGLAAAAIAFWGLGHFARTAVVFFAVSAAFGGAVYAVLGLGGGRAAALSPRTLLLSFAICYAALSLVFRGRGLRTARETAAVQAQLHGLSVSFTALRDTGNELRDPGGFPVLTAEWEAVAPLFPGLKACPADAAGLFLALCETGGMAGRCRLLPCLTAGGTGLLCAFRPDSLLINGAEAPHRYIAVTTGPLSPGGEYKAIF